MASLDFDREQQAFRTFYAECRPLLEKALKAYIGSLRAVLKQSGIGAIAKIEGRVKDEEECLKKFVRKYRGRFEAAECNYEIKDYITDLLGIRVICFYEDQIGPIAALLQEHYRVLEVTDKIAAVESTEDLFGYKGLHMDLAVDARTAPFLKAPPQDFPFEVQIRSLIQDAWSVLDHQIKYKKSIPSDLKRRINVLSALFELADREFREIRDATAELLQQATVAPVSDQPGEEAGAGAEVAAGGPKGVNAFNFLRIVRHFFRDFEFEDAKVDDFVEEILRLHGTLQRSELHRSLLENLKPVRDYRDEFMAEFPEKTFSPYTMIRHCLYRHDPEIFGRILSRGPRERFAAWLKGQG